MSKAIYIIFPEREYSSAHYITFKENGVTAEQALESYLSDEGYGSPNLNEIKHGYTVYRLADPEKFTVKNDLTIERIS